MSEADPGAQASPLFSDLLKFRGTKTELQRHSFARNKVNSGNI